MAQNDRESHGSLTDQWSTIYYIYSKRVQYSKQHKRMHNLLAGNVPDRHQFKTEPLFWT